MLKHLFLASLIFISGSIQATPKDGDSISQNQEDGDQYPHPETDQSEHRSAASKGEEKYKMIDNNQLSLPATLFLASVFGMLFGQILSS